MAIIVVFFAKYVKGVSLIVYILKNTKTCMYILVYYYIILVYINISLLSPIQGRVPDYDQGVL